MLKFTLIPEAYFSPEAAADLLSKVVVLEKSDSVKSLELPCYKAVLLYAGAEGDARRIADMLEAAAALDRYNKVVVHLGERTVEIVVAAGDRLLLCNAYPAPDEVTAHRPVLSLCSPETIPDQPAGDHRPFFRRGG